MPDALRSPWAVAHSQVILSMGFPRQEYWSGLSFPSPRETPDPEIKPMSPALDSLPLSHLGSPQLPCCSSDIQRTHFFLRNLTLSLPSAWNDLHSDKPEAVHTHDTSGTIFHPDTFMSCFFASSRSPDQRGLLSLKMLPTV